ncbi:MAG: ABC transporter permease subunit [Nitrosomonadales bacterium]|nr:MAG: ABC transporter permease subunit [Nitrosomonadales bacterium]
MTLADAARHAFELLIGGDAQLWGIIWISLRVSCLAMLAATPFAVALGFMLATLTFPGRRLLIVALQTMLALPTVVVGLLLYLILSRQGPLGEWHWLFTQEAMILGQAVLAFPILAAMTLSAVQGVDRRAAETAKTLGANPMQAVWTVLVEARFAVLAAIATGFGRVLSEIGCAMMVGGNIAGVTRNITTAIALETSKGEFAQGIALGVVLVILALAINFVMAFFQGKGLSR